MSNDNAKKKTSFRVRFFLTQTMDDAGVATHGTQRPDSAAGPTGERDLLQREVVSTAQALAEEISRSTEPRAENKNRTQVNGDRAHSNQSATEALLHQTQNLSAALRELGEVIRREGLDSRPAARKDSLKPTAGWDDEQFPGSQFLN